VHGAVRPCQGYQIVAEVGLVGWLASVQAAVFDGEYYVVATGMVTVVVMVLPVVLVIQGLARVMR
jgi:hypothetical protein